MERRGRGFITFLVAATALALAAVPAHGQGQGDYDGDGDVDGDDFWYWAGCMTGPAGGPLGPGCEAFDFDPFLAPDAKVDLADFTAFGQVFHGSGVKVPLGGQLASTTEGGLFKVYVPTKWGGVLTVATSAGSIADLKYPDGSPFQNGTDTGENRHGWYTFVVTGSTNYTVSATFVQTGTAARRPWNFYWWAKKGVHPRKVVGRQRGGEHHGRAHGRAGHRPGAAGERWGGHCAVLGRRPPGNQPRARR